MIHRSDKSKGSGNTFQPIDNRLLRDLSISFGARGLMAYLLSKPDDWQVRNYDLYRQSPDSKSQVDRYLRELKTAFYLVRYRVSGGRTEIEWFSELYEVPVLNPKHPQFFFDTAHTTIENPAIEIHDVESGGLIPTTESERKTDSRKTEAASDQQKNNDLELIALQKIIIPDLSSQYRGVSWQHARLLSHNHDSLVMGLFSAGDVERMNYYRPKVRDRVSQLLQRHVEIEFVVLD